MGDMVAAGLEKVGVTKGRVRAVVGDCGCKQRQQWLNEVGYSVGIGTPNPDEPGNPKTPPPG